MAIVELTQLSQIREMVGLKPSQVSAESRRRDKEQGKHTLETVFMNMIDKRGDLIIGALEDARDELIDGLYLQPTPAGIAARYVVDRIARVIYTISLGDLDQKDIPNFTLYYDMAYGITTIGAKIGLADRVSAMGIDQTVTRSGLNPLGQFALRVDAQFVKELFDKDQGKGFVLAETYVDVLRGNVPARVTVIGPSHIRDFVVAGAELGAEYYKRVHSLASNLGN